MFVRYSDEETQTKMWKRCFWADSENENWFIWMKSFSTRPLIFQGFVCEDSLRIYQCIGTGGLILVNKLLIWLQQYVSDLLLAWKLILVRPGRRTRETAAVKILVQVGLHVCTDMNHTSEWVLASIYVRPPCQHALACVCVCVTCSSQVQSCHVLFSASLSP